MIDYKQNFLFNIIAEVIKQILFSNFSYNIIIKIVI